MRVAAGGRTAGERKGSKGFDAAPSGAGIGARIAGHIGHERNGTSRIKPDERCDTSDVRRFGILGCRRRESPRGVALDIDDVCSREIVGNESEFLLNAGRHKEGSGLAMGSGEGGALVPSVALRLGLEVGIYVYVRTRSATFAEKAYNE